MMAAHHAISGGDGVLAQLVEIGTIAGTQPVGQDLYLVHLHLPDLARLVHPGQFLLVRCTDPINPTADPFLPRAYFVYAADDVAGRLSLLVARQGRGSAWLTGRADGEAVQAHGPAGRAITLGRRTSHLLILADGPMGVAATGYLASTAARRGLGVTLVEHTVAGEAGVPATLLHTDVEYRTSTAESGGLLGALPELLRWSDELVVAASAAFLETTASLRRARLEPFTLHGGMPVQAIPLDEIMGTPHRGGGDFLPCGSGSCGACRLPVRHGYRLFCEHGPAFMLDELRFDTRDPSTDDQSEADDRDSPDTAISQGEWDEPDEDSETGRG